MKQEILQENQTKPLGDLKGSKMIIKKNKYRHKNSTADKIFIVSMLSLFLVQFLIFWVYVNAQSILMAFQLPSGEWSLDTFRYVFDDFKGNLGDSLGGSLLESLKNTLMFWFSGILMIPLNLFITYLFYKKIKGYKVWQVMLHLPGIIGGLVMITAFKNFLRPDYGPLGVLIKNLFGINGHLITMPDYAIWVILFYSLWMGWSSNMMLFGGAMARIPVEILESARIDGVGSFREFTKIIFPLVWPTVSTVLILSLTGIISADGGTLVFTQGSAKTYTIAYWFYAKQLAGPAYYNQVSAAGLLFTVVLVPIILFTRWLIEKVPTVDY